MQDRSRVRRERTRRRRGRFWGAGALVLLGMLAAWIGGYLLRTPLAPSESLVALVDFEPVFLGRCSSGQAVWTALENLPRYREVANTLEGRMFLDATPLARARVQVEERTRVFGRPLMDVFDALGDEVMVAGVPARGETDAFLCASRLRPSANLVLGVYAAFKESERLPTPAGDWWMVLQGSVRVGWTKVGDVLAVSNNAELLGRFVAAARHGRRRRGALADALSGGAEPELAMRLRPMLRSRIEDRLVDGLPDLCVFSLRLGRDGEPAGEGEGESEHAAFRRRVGRYLPEDTCAGVVWHQTPAKAWRTAQDALSESGRDTLLRYVEDDLCAALDVDRFDDEVLSSLSGDWAVLMSPRRDPWLHLASGQPAPITSVVLRTRSDSALARRLAFALKQAEGKFEAEDPSLKADVLEVRHRGYRIKTMRARRADNPQTASAGYVVVPEGEGSAHSLIIASTSLGWLRRAIDAREGRGPALSAQSWFRCTLDPVPAGQEAFTFVRWDQVLGAVGRLRGAPGAPPSAGERWLTLLGAVGVDARIDERGAVHATLRVTGESLMRPAPAARGGSD